MGKVIRWIQITRKLGLSCGMATHTLLLVTWPEIVEILPGDVFWDISCQNSWRCGIWNDCHLFMILSFIGCRLCRHPKNPRLDPSQYPHEFFRMNFEVFPWESLTWTSAKTSPADCKLGFRIRKPLAPKTNGYPGWWITNGSSNLVSGYPLVSTFTHNELERSTVL